MVHIYIAFVCLVSIMPTLTSLIVSIYIMKIVSTHRKQLAEEQALCHPTTPGRSNSNTMIRSRMRTFYLIFMMTVFTAITLLPYRLTSIHRLIANHSSQKDCLTILIFWVMMYMIYLNSIVNPLLTVTVLPQYRMTFVNKFFFLTEEQNGHHTTTTTVAANGVNGVGRTSL
uniref:G-protein coupled receptors family 1 profile domain-containing protein n=1 Tax=Acrobeloides nanus TaxID=290746 RepID=A0A914EJX2_9BILA